MSSLDGRYDIKVLFYRQIPTIYLIKASSWLSPMPLLRAKLSKNARNTQHVRPHLWEDKQLCFRLKTFHQNWDGNKSSLLSFSRLIANIYLIQPWWFHHRINLWLPRYAYFPAGFMRSKLTLGKFAGQSPPSIFTTHFLLAFQWPPTSVPHGKSCPGLSGGYLMLLRKWATELTLGN